MGGLPRCLCPIAYHIQRDAEPVMSRCQTLRVGGGKADPTTSAGGRKIVFLNIFTDSVPLETLHNSAPLEGYELCDAVHCKPASFSKCGYSSSLPCGSPRGRTLAQACRAGCSATRQSIQNAKIGATRLKINVKNFPRRRSQIWLLGWT